MRTQSLSDSAMRNCLTDDLSLVKDSRIRFFASDDGIEEFLWHFFAALIDVSTHQQQRLTLVAPILTNTKQQQQQQQQQLRREC